LPVNEPVRILSDLHLGHKVSRIEDIATLRPLIAGAGTVIFNGDTWQELAKPFLERATAMLGGLKALCHEEGADAVFLPGNHDPSWPGQGWAELAGGRIIVTHGDTLLREGSPWKREILLAEKHIARIWKHYPAAEFDPEERVCVARDIARELCSVEYPTGRRVWQRAWDAVLPPQRAVKMIEAWFTQGTAGADFCDRFFPEAEILVIGHFHRVGSWFIRGRRVINLGSFTTPGRAQWMEWHDGWLSRGWVDESATECQKGATVDVWRL
jgi:predicted phosphodiesterase